MVQVNGEALGALVNALGRLGEASDGLSTQVEAQTRAFVQETDAVRRKCSNRVGAIEATLRAREQDDPGLRQRLEQAREALRSAERACLVARDGQQEIAAARRSAVLTLGAHISDAKADLARRGNVVQRYGQGGVVGSSASASTLSSPGTTGGGSASGLADHGVVQVDLSTVDFSDNPISSYGKGGAGATDYRWAVDTWETVVQPGVAKGMTRDDFAFRDAERGAPPFRRTADVFDLMLGDTDKIVYSRRPNGTLDVVNGRHRIEVARKLGITQLPGRII